MSQSPSQGGRAPAKRAMTPSRRKDVFDALDQKFSQLEKEIKDFNEQHNSRVKKATDVYKNAVSRAYMEHLAILYDVLEKSKPEDTKKQEHEELVSAVQNEIDKVKKSVAKDKEDNRVKNPGSNAAVLIRIIKAKAIREKPKEIKKLNDTAEGKKSVESTEAKLPILFKVFESNIRKIDKEYSENAGDLYKRHKEIEDELNKMGVGKVEPGSEDKPGSEVKLGSRADAIKMAGSKDLHELLKVTKEKNKTGKRRKLLEK